MPEARNIKTVPEPEPLTTEAIAERAAFYAFRDSVVYRALQELIALRQDLARLPELADPSNCCIDGMVHQLAEGKRLDG